jgi:hypothetical protein
MTMQLAGIPIRDDAVLELARLVDDPALAERLEDAYRRKVKILALEIPERETILAALDDPPLSQVLRPLVVRRDRTNRRGGSPRARHYPPIIDLESRSAVARPAFADGGCLGIAASERFAPLLAMRRRPTAVRPRPYPR